MLVLGSDGPGDGFPKGELALDLLCQYFLLSGFSEIKYAFSNIFVVFLDTSYIYIVSHSTHIQIPVYCEIHSTHPEFSRL